MAIVISTDVFCDGEDCPWWVGGATGPKPRARAARNEAKRQGWKITKGKDLCPRCSKEPAPTTADRAIEEDTE